MSRRSLLIVLFVSLAVNLFLVGALAGGLVIGQRLRGDRTPPMQRGMAQPLWRAGDALPPERAQAYRQALSGAGPELRQAMRDARAERNEAWKSLGAEPFDAAGVKRRLAEVRGHEAEARGRIEERIVDYAAGLPAADRAALARGLTERPRGDRPRGDGPRGDGPPPGR